MDGPLSTHNFYNDPQVGWCYDPQSDSESSYPGMLFDKDRRILLTIPISSEERYSKLSRKFSTEDEVYADDEDRNIFEYTFPRTLIFDSFNETATLLNCRRIGHRFKALGAAQGEVEVGLVISGGKSPDYEKPNKVRSYIPGMSAWTLLDPLKVDHQIEDSRVKSFLISAGETRTLQLLEGLELKEDWSATKKYDDSIATIVGEVFIESMTEEATHYQRHLDKHYLFRDLVDIAYWKPTGFRKLRFSRDDEKRTLNQITGHMPDETNQALRQEWRDVKTYEVRYQNNPHSTIPLFYFPHVGQQGIKKWQEIRSKYSRAIDPLLKLLDLSDAFLESRFIQSCVGLEGIGTQLAWDEEPGNTRRRQERLADRFERIIADIGLTFSDNWPSRAADAYNSIKHYDRNSPIDPYDIEILLLENELIFRTWAALKIGVDKKIIKENISSVPSAQTLKIREVFALKEV